MDGTEGSTLRKYLGSARSSRKKPRWLHPEQSTGDIYSGINLGGKFCWDAVGPARATFVSLGSEIKAFLDKQSDPIRSPVTWTMYMIGRTPESSRPTIMFCGADKNSRKFVKDTVDKSGLLDKYPGVETGGCSQEFRRFALNDAIDPPFSSLPTLEKSILYSPSQVGQGMQIFIRGYNGYHPEFRKSRCGGLLYHQGRRFVQTVAHVFEKTDSFDSLETYPGSDCPFEFELDDYSESGMEDPDVEISSSGSGTPETNYDDIGLSPTSNSETSSISQECCGRSLLAVEDPEEHTENKVIPEPQFQLQSPLSSFGSSLIFSVNGSSMGLDYCLIEIESSRTSSFEEAFHNSGLSPTFGSFIEPIVTGRPRDVEVFALTGRPNPIRGRLSGTPTFLMLPGSAFAQEVWTVRDLYAIADGDCGSWVVDVATGDLYGHIIAGSPKSGLTYIIPTQLVLEDLRERFGEEWSLNPKTRKKEEVQTPFNQAISTESHESTQSTALSWRQQTSPSKRRRLAPPGGDEYAQMGESNALTQTSLQRLHSLSETGQSQSQMAAEWSLFYESTEYGSTHSQGDYWSLPTLCSIPSAFSSELPSEDGSNSHQSDVPMDDSVFGYEYFRAKIPTFPNTSTRILWESRSAINLDSTHIMANEISWHLEEDSSWRPTEEREKAKIQNNSAVQYGGVAPSKKSAPLKPKPGERRCRMKPNVASKASATRKIRACFNCWAFKVPVSATSRPRGPNEYT
jgi:hypothetical protein